MIFDCTLQSLETLWKYMKVLRSPSAVFGEPLLHKTMISHQPIKGAAPSRAL